LIQAELASQVGLIQALEPMDRQQSVEASDTPPGSSGIAWRRVLTWSMVIYISVSLVAFLFGLSMAAWQIYGLTLEEATETNRQIRIVFYWTTAALLYWRFAAPLSRRAVNVLAVFIAYELISGLVLVFAFGDPVSELLAPWTLGRSVIAAIIGWGIASLGSNNSFKPKPLRGSA